jgi:hydrogenase maturation protein HypF
VKEPRRSALGLLYELFGDELFGMEPLTPLQAFSATERRVLRTMLRRHVNSPRTSSAGRLFDGVAALAGFRSVARFEGQAAMELEFALDGVETDRRYDFALTAPAGSEAQAPLVVDWGPLVQGVLHDVEAGVARGLIAATYHLTLVDMILAVARHVGEERVLLTGGCFQNRYLTERAACCLLEAGFRPYWHQQVLPNDSGIALGQVMAAARQGGRE